MGEDEIPYVIRFSLGIVTGKLVPKIREERQDVTSQLRVCRNSKSRGAISGTLASNINPGPS